MIALWSVLTSPVAAAPPAPVPIAVSASEGRPDMDAPWWRLLDDPSLEALVTEGIASNPDLSVAVARLQQAEGAFWQTRSRLAPTVSFDVVAAHQPVNRGSFVPASASGATTQNTMQLWLRGGYELDLFGRNVLQTRASRHDQRASEGDRDATAAAIALRVGEAYYDLATARLRSDQIVRQVQTNRELLAAVEKRRDAAAASTVDVLQQRQQVAALEALVPSATAAVDLAAFRLSVLLGRPDVSEPIATRGLPAVGEAPSTGAAADLLTDRPDLRAAKGRATAARARKSAATLGFFPTLSVSGQVGWFSIWWGDQSPTLQEAYQVSAQLSVPLFEGGRRHGMLRTARGQEYAASEGYRGATLRALQQVEGARLQDRAAAARLVATERSEALARASYERSREQWLEGVASYLTVFTNLGSWQRAELDLIDARRAAVGARIQLHDALGGAWTRGLGAREDR